MVRRMTCWWFAGLVVTATSPIAPAEDGPAAEVEALGARCSRDPAGETIGVDLSNTWVTDADLAKVARLPRLRSIDLAHTRITDQGLEALAGVTKLQQLSLDSTNVTDASVRFLQGFRQLRKLNLYHTFVTEKGCRQVREAIPRCEIIFDPKSSDPKRRRS